MPIDGRTMRDSNFPSDQDTTTELIRKHAIYKAELRRITSEEIVRSEDYWGGYDDVIANDVTAIEDMLYTRAVMHHDLDAIRYIYDAGGVSGVFSVERWLGVMMEAVDALKAGDTTRALELLTPITPDPWQLDDA